MPQILTFTSQRKSRGLPSRPHLPKFDHHLWGVKEDKPAEQVQTAPQSPGNNPKTIQEIDDLLSEAGAGMLPLTAHVKISEWTGSITKVNPFNSFTSAN